MSDLRLAIREEANKIVTEVWNTALGLTLDNGQRLRQWAVSEIEALLVKTMEEVIGEDEPDKVVEYLDKGSQIVQINPRNQLRAEQHERLQNIIGGKP